MNLTRLLPQRQKFLQTLFPSGVPTLWCPTLTHFAPDGSIDGARMQAHLNFMLPWVKGFLVGGSTGEGWELSDTELSNCVALVSSAVTGRDAHILVGALRPTVEAMHERIALTVRGLKPTHHVRGSLDDLAQSSLCGFTICAPWGAQLSQDELTKGLSEILALGFPTALYQLPQVTQNEISPATARTLSHRFGNLYVLKDTSGTDRIVESGFREVLLLRGAEGDYHKHHGSAGGAYDGFLLSTANCFAYALSRLIQDLDRGNLDSAAHTSARLDGICSEVFALSAQCGFGNAFTNANKALDHFFAYGPNAVNRIPPLVHSGARLPHALIAGVGAILERFDLMPAKGYL